MALFDRLKDATKPTNTIEAVQQPGPEQRQEPRLGQSTPATPATVVSEAPSPSQSPAKPAQGQAKAPAYTSEPEAISRSYYVEDRGTERRYFDDYQKKALAIRADDTTINSKREDLNTIRAMLTMAEARGWSEVKVAGSAEFKREAWIEAAARGITAQGYKAGDLDRQEADRRRAERGPDAARPVGLGDGNEVRRATPQQAAPAPGPVQPAVETTRTQADATQAPARQAKPADAVQPAAAAEATQARKAAPGEPEKPAPQLTEADHRKVAKEAAATLSDDGKLVFAAMSEKIDRQMNKLNAEGKAEMKAYVATELVKKEKAEGPVMLTKEQRQLATGPEPVQAPLQAQAQTPAAQQAAPAPRPAQAPERAPEVPERAPRPARDEPEPEPPRRRRSR